jgi:hypothetical protein
MVGIVISLIAALPAAWAAGSTCDQGLGPSSCDVAAEVGEAAAPSTDEPRYATEVIADCPTPLVDALSGAYPGTFQGTSQGTSAGTSAGECDETPFDGSYRASRDPESERMPGSLRPGRRERPNGAVRAACTGSPIDGRDGAGNPDPTQPLALFELPGLATFSSSSFSIDAPAALPWRHLRPLERPPRA